MDRIEADMGGQVASPPKLMPVLTWLCFPTNQSPGKSTRQY